MASHRRGDSISSSSSLTSISSRSSIETYETLKEEITSVEKSETDLQELVDAAEKIIQDKFASEPQSIFTYRKESISVNLAAVMSAMLAHAEECGGDSGKRYVASAIVACTRREGNGGLTDVLAALGVTWLTHLLFIFKTSKSHETQPNDEPHELATPTVQTTISHVGEGVGPRNASFRDDLMIRDGYTCVITGSEDYSHPRPDNNAPTSTLQASHILRRAIGKFNKDHTSDSFKSALTTFDILVNFTRLPVAALEELSEHLDDASNGMMLHYDAHITFDQFYWCFKKTETDDVYTLKFFKALRVHGMSENKFITFTDRSGMVSEGSTSKKRNRPIPLPNPHYLAIHAAIAGILHMSGAGRFFDELLDKFKDDEGNVRPVQSWSELENVMEEDALRESLQFLEVH